METTVLDSQKWSKLCRIKPSFSFIILLKMRGLNMEFIIEMSDFVIQSKIVYLSNEYALQTIPKLPTEVSLLFENLCINK